jgi:hypothetical protein
MRVTRTGIGIFVLVLLALLWIRPAEAVPSYAVQTGLPCSTCHVGSFGPQLKPFGRQFKLNGYVLSDGQEHDLPPLTFELLTSYTHLASAGAGGKTYGVGQTACAACHPGQFGGSPVPRNDVTADSLSLYYAGRVTENIGAFAQVNFDGISNSIHWGNIDLRYATTGRLFGEDLVIGIDLNNNPTVQDLWNTTPQWTFPFAQSQLARTPAAATLIDGALAQTVGGAGVYAQWNDLLYVEFAGYHDIGVDARDSLGITPASGQNILSGVAPYWRVALQHSMGSHDFEFGTYGILTHDYPTDVRTFGTDRFTDIAFDAQYQYIPSDDFNLGVYATYIDERERFGASHQLIFSQPTDRLQTWRANVSASWEDTYTLNARYFVDIGTTDATIFGTETGSPNSAGYIVEVDWAPNGKPGASFLPNWLNVKFSAQYVGYTRFNGQVAGASSNNDIFFSAWWAVPLNGGW